MAVVQEVLMAYCFCYGPAAGLPTLSVGGNYWADVVFTNPVVNWPLNLTQITDNNGCSVTVNQLVTQSVNNPLPVSFTEFSAKLDQDNNVKLDWSTSSESNNKGFEIKGVPMLLNGSQ